MIRLDGMLILQQVNGEWVCRRIESFVTEHMYGEYKSHADGLADDAINKARQHSSRIVMNNTWLDNIAFIFKDV